MMTIFFLGCGVSCIAAGMAAGPLALSIALGALGVFAAIYHPVGIAMVTEVAERRGQALAVNGVCGNVGLAAAAITTGFLAENFGWRMAFFVPGFFALAAGAGYFLLGRRARKAKDATTTKSSHIDAGRAIWPIFIFVAVAALFGGTIFNAVSLSLPKLLAERLVDHTTSLSAVGTYAALVFAISGLAQLPVGWYLDRYDVKPLLIVLFTLQTLALGITAVTFGMAIVPLAMVTVLMMFSWIPVTSWLVGTYVPVEWRSRVFSVEYTFSLGTSALVVPAIAGLHANGYGFSFQYVALACFAMIVLAAALFLPARRQMQVTA